ncbi:MAG: glycine cleavage system protein R [Acidobacteriota bacterium]|nr:MAG: glycine cleavage system protein R [Acidobacteriota bacterium]
MSVNTSMVLVLLGEDRPGLVRKVSSLIVERGGNWMESHLSSMAGFFGGMIHLNVPADQADSLRTALRDLEAEGLTILVQTAAHESLSAGVQAVQLEVIGNDRPGIVNRISEAIAAKRVNLEKIESECTSAPMSGTEIFTLKAELIVPSDLSLEELRSDLEKIATDLMVDISFD